MLPCICFNDDRNVCERLAEQVLNLLTDEEREFMESAEFKERLMIKDADKLEKQMKRQRDKDAKKAKGKKNDETDDVPVDMQQKEDPVAAMQQRQKDALSRFKLAGIGKDADLYRKTLDRLEKRFLFLTK